MKVTKQQLKRLVLEVMSTMDIIDDETFLQQFKKWATEYMGTPAGANSSSVLATFLVDQGYDKDENIMADMSNSLGFDLRDVEMEVKRQRKEYEAGGVVSDQESYERSFKESKAKITKRQLKRIIKEEKTKLLREGMMDAEEALFTALDNYVIALFDRAGERVPAHEQKAEILTFVDGYLEQSEYAAEQAEREEGLAVKGFKNPSYG